MVATLASAVRWSLSRQADEAEIENLGRREREREREREFQFEAKNERGEMLKRERKCIL
jgi:hypothetical protein